MKADIKTIKVVDQEYPVVGYKSNACFHDFYYKVEVDGHYLYTETYNVSVSDDGDVGVLVKGSLRRLPR